MGLKLNVIFVDFPARNRAGFNVSFNILFFYSTQKKERKGKI